MIDNIISELKTSELGKATRKSAQVILKANMHAWTTTRTELGKVAQLALRQSRQISRKSRSATEEVVENLSDAANERVGRVERRFQDGVNRVIHEIGLPTAGEVEKLSKKVNRLSKEVESRAAAKRRVPRKKAVAKRRTRRAA